ncbi:MAG: 5-formyltetrahydrofolate cyclo-ligase [Proteobacteria bacterium]|nr:5-formyltetrahydrofolate cyclo-ligase [Pseudomonadota bacterium]
MITVAEKKNHLRAEAKSRRATLSRDASGASGASLALADGFCDAADNFESGNIAGYWPIADEMDVRPLLECLARLGRSLSLPCIAGPNDPLAFREWLPGDALAAGPFGTQQPAEDAAVVGPSVLLIPLLAFDAAGGRLGYGGGYYDRTLAALRKDGHIMAVGVAYAGQEIDCVPTESGDQFLDWIATESGFRRLGAEN